jgi:predicted naringenin-chalcone synthase
MRMAEKTAETLESGETRNRKATAPLDDVTLTNVVADRNHFFVQKARSRGKLSGALLSGDRI